MIIRVSFKNKSLKLLQSY